MQKKLLLLSAGLLALGLAGCNQNPAQTSSLPDTSAQDTTGDTTSQADSSAEASSEDESHIAGRIIVCEDQDTADIYGLEVLPFDIGLGDVIDLENHVMVSKVNHWSISTKNTDVIEITDHSFKALGYGTYTITITAGSTKRAINGSVVQASKLAFNEKFAALSNLEYMLSGQVTGAVLVHDNYWLEPGEYDNDGNVLNMQGAIEHPDPKNGMTYSFNLGFNETGEDFADTITMNKGYGRSVAAKGFGKDFDGISAKDFQPQYDSDGEFTGYYIYECNDTDEYGESTVSRFVNSLVGYEIWGDISYYVTSTYESEPSYYADLDLAVRYNAKEEKISFYPALKSGRIATYIVMEDTRFKAAIDVTNIGDTEVQACEDWLADPVIPDPIDTTSIRNVFAQIFESKAYSMKATGQWYDPSKNDRSIDVPDGFKFDTGEEVFSNYDIDVNVNQHVIEEVFNTLSESAYIPADDYTLPAEGDRSLFFVANNYAQTAKYSDGEWGAIVSGEDVFDEDAEAGNEPTVWDSTLVPYVFGDDFKYDLLSMASIYDYKATEDAEYFYYNANGMDMDLGISKYYAGLPYFFAAMTPEMVAYVPVFYLNYANWYNYCDMFFTVIEDALSFQIDFKAGSEASYRMKWTFSNVGTDTVSPDVMDIYNEFVNPTIE